MKKLSLLRTLTLSLMLMMVGMVNAEEAVALLNTKGYTTLKDALDATKPGEVNVITLLKDIDASDLVFTACNNKTVILKGNTGTEELNLGSGHKGGIQNSYITFLDLKIKIRHTTVTGTWYTEGFYHATKIKYENVVFDGAICTYDDVDFLKCKFTSNPQNAEYGVWNYGGTQIFKGCTFEAASAGTKSFIKLYNQGMAASAAVVDCEFIDPTPLPGGWKGCDIYNSNPAGLTENAKLYLSNNTTTGTLLGHSAGSDAKVTICNSAAEMGITMPTPTVLPENIYTRDVTSERYGTICLPYASSNIEGMTVYNILGKDPNGGLYLEVLNDDMVAGVPYIFLPTQGATQLSVNMTGTAVTTAQNVNGLVGTLVDIFAPNSPTNYILSENCLYFVDNANVKVGANRAYVKLDEVPLLTNEQLATLSANQAAVRISVFGGNPMVTGVEEATAAKATKALVNGKLVIKKGAHSFNANGAMLK